MTTREVPRRFGVDVVLALAVTVVVVWGCYSESNPSAGAAQMLRGHVVLRPSAWAYLPVVAAGLALAWRRRRPRTVLGVSLAGVLTFTALGYIGYAALIIPPIALYTVALTAGAGEAAVLALATLLALAGVHVLILTTFESDKNIYEALRSGASGFVVKDTEPPELLQAVRIVAAGDALLSPRVTRRIIADIAAGGRPDRAAAEFRIDRLTDRERQVLALVGRGRSNDEIAADLFLSPFTAKTHVSRVMTKLGARDRAQLVVIAYETGLVTTGVRRGPPY